MAEVEPVSQRGERTEPTSSDPAGWLLAEVKHRGHLPPDVAPEEAIRAVMCTFSQHLSGGEARHVFRALPSSVQPLLDRCMLHRAENAEGFGRDELLRRVAEHLHVPVADAEAITSTVLHALASRLSARDISDVAEQLPRELRHLWVVPKVPVGAPVHPHPILTRIERSVRLPEDVSGMGAFTSAVGHLSQALDAPDARQLIAALPSDLRQLVESFSSGRGELPQRMGKAGFLRRVARDLHLRDPDQAEQAARAVFRHLEEHIPAAVFDRVASRLPPELSDIWTLP